MSLFRAVRNRPASRLLPVLLLLLPAAAPVPAQTRKPAEARKPVETFEGTSHVVAVEVPVNVVGRDGEPVRGLTVDDFEVYDGSERQKISAFEMVDLKTLATAAAAVENAAAPAVPAPAPARSAADLPSGARRHFLLFFDLSFSSPTSILKARLAARDFVLHSLHPADLAAVATYSMESGPKLVVTFTPDRAQLARAIDTLGFRQALDTRMADPLRFMIDTPASAATEAALNIADTLDLKSQKDQILFEYLKTINFAQERSERTFEQGKIVGYSRALGELARALNSVKGRKHVLYFSEGFDSRLLFGRQTTDLEADTDNSNIAFGQTWMVDNDARFGSTGLQKNLGRMLDEFRRADCVIEAVDIGGLRAGGDQAARPSGQEGLFYLANETGGELFKDANNLREPLARVLERTSVTYVLTFERSDLKLDGSYHRLRVKAKLPAGARLAHRSGYYAPRPFKDLDPLEKNLLAADGIASATPRRDVDLHVLAAPFRAGAALSYVPVIVEVGGRSLLEGQTGSKLNVEIYTYVSNAEGRMKDFFSQRVDLDLGKGRHQILRPFRPAARRLPGAGAGAQRRDRPHRRADGAGRGSRLQPGADRAAPPVLHGGPAEVAAGAGEQPRRSTELGGLSVHRRRAALRALRPADPARRVDGAALPGGLQPGQGRRDGAGPGPGRRRHGLAVGAAVQGAAHEHRHPGPGQAGGDLRSRGAPRRQLRPAGGGDRPDDRPPAGELSTLSGDSLIFFVERPSCAR